MKESVIVIIISDDETQIVAIKRRDVKMWVLPGGGIDPGETPEQAALREVLEETGLTVEIIRKGAEYQPVSKLSRLTHVFVCKSLSGELKKGPETGDIGYFPFNALPPPFFYIHQMWIDEILKSPAAPIIRTLREVNAFSFIKYFLKHPINVIRFALSRLGLPINR